MDNVIDIFSKACKQPETEEATELEGFEAVAAANKAKEERMKQERAKANRSVLRSYRLKT